jgi:NAD(P)H-hydrate epimerase
VSVRRLADSLELKNNIMVSPVRFAFLSTIHRTANAYVPQSSSRSKDFLRLIPAVAFVSSTSAAAVVLQSKATSTEESAFGSNNTKTIIGSKAGIHFHAAAAIETSQKGGKEDTADKKEFEIMEETIMTGFLNAKDAAALDEELMSDPGFSLEQLMELAGLAVAEAVYQAYPPPNEFEFGTANKKRPKVLLVCGPGNNGGDGLVAARHLVHFGYDCAVVYPKRPSSSKSSHFVNLVCQCEDMNIPILDHLPKNWVDESSLVVDAIFGFSFHGEPREPFATILTEIVEQSRVPVISVDVPSGWNVDEGDVAGTGFMPGTRTNKNTIAHHGTYTGHSHSHSHVVEQTLLTYTFRSLFIYSLSPSLTKTTDALVSLTTPKHCSKSYKGRHFVGGRFLPPRLAQKYGVKVSYVVCCHLPRTLTRTLK